MNDAQVPPSEAAPPAWTGAWVPGGWEGNDPQLRDKRRQWWSAPAHRQVRTDKESRALEKWLAEEDWSEDGTSMMALRAAAFRAGEGREDYARILGQVIHDGRVPLEKLDLWAEQWMVGKWVGAIIERLEQPEFNTLFQTLAERWPWPLVQAGRSAIGPQAWRHPVLDLLRSERLDLAMELTARILPSDWMDMGGDYYQKRRWWREQKHWFKDDPSWISHLMKVAPSLLEIDHNSGMGPLEQAAFDLRPGMLSYLMGAGFKPQPALSFGLDLPHWAAFSVSETRWCSRTSSALDKSHAEISQDLRRLTEFLHHMESMGLDTRSKVLDTDTRGIKRKRNMPKPKQDVSAYLRKRKFTQEHTRVGIETALLEAYTQQVAAPRKSKTLRL